MTPNNLLIDFNDVDSEITEEGFDYSFDIPTTWDEARTAEKVQYKFQSQFLPNQTATFQQNIDSTKNSTFDSHLEELRKIKNWKNFSNYELTLQKEVEDYQKQMRNLLSENFGVYVTVEDHLRTKFRNDPFWKKNSWDSSENNIKQVNSGFDTLLNDLFLSSRSIDDITKIQGLLKGKWKSALSLKSQLDIALASQDFPKIVSIYFKLKALRSQNSSLYFENRYFSFIEQGLLVAQSQLFETLLNTDLKFVERENALRFMREIEVSNPNPDHCVLVSEYHSFRCKIENLMSSFKNNSWNAIFDLGMSIIDDSVTNATPLYLKSIQRDHAIEALNSLCKISTKSFAIFLRFCDIIQDYSPYCMFRESLKNDYLEKSDRERRMALLRLSLYSQTEDPTFLSEYDLCSYNEIHKAEIIPSDANQNMDSKLETTFVVLLLSEHETKKLNITVSQSMLAVDFFKLCCIQFLIDDESNFILISDRNFKEISGPIPLSQFKQVETKLSKIREPELFLVSKTFLPPPKKEAQSFQYFNVFDYLSIQDMIDEMGTLFQTQCFTLFSIIDNGESYQPHLFALMEKAIETTEKFSTMISTSNLDIEGFSAYPKKLRLYALNVALGRYISEVKSLPELETWELLENRTALPDHFSVKCRSFIYLTRGVVTILEKKEIMSDFTRLFDAYLGEYEKMATVEEVSCSNIHISEQLYFRKLMILLANLTYTQKKIIPDLSQLFERSFGVSIQAVKKSLSTRVDKYIASHMENIISFYSGKLKELTKEYLIDLSTYLPIHNQIDRNSNTLSSGGMNIVMRYNSSIFNELTLLYSRIEELSLYDYNLVNEIIRELTLFIHDNASDYINNNNEHLVFAQIIVWNEMFISTRKHNSVVLNAMKELQTLLPPLKLRSQFSNAIKTLLAEYPYFIEH